MRNNRLWPKNSIKKRIKGIKACLAVLLSLGGCYHLIAEGVPGGKRVLPDISRFTEFPLSEYMSLRGRYGVEIRQFMTPEGILCQVNTHDTRDILCQGSYPDYLPANRRVMKNGKCLFYYALLPNARYYDDHPDWWPPGGYPPPAFPDTTLGDAQFTPRNDNPGFGFCGFPPYPKEVVTPLVLLKNHMLIAGYKISFKGIVCAELDNHVFTCQSGKRGFVLAPDGKSWEQ